MSSSLRIATATAALGTIVRDAIVNMPNASAPPRVQYLRPSDATKFVGVNIYLYRTKINEFLSQDDLPTRDSDGALRRRPTVAVDLEYLMTFHGEDRTLEPQRLLERTTAAIHAEPVILAPRQREAIAAYAWLTGSDAATQLDPVRVTSIPLNLDEHSRVWSIMVQTPYQLSAIYRASTVVVQAEIPLASVPPAPVAVDA